MTTEEKKIEETAKAYAGFSEDQNPNDPDNRRYATSNRRKYDDFVTGAKSDAAKEYHTKGMFTKEEVLSFFEKYEPNLAVTILKSEFDKNKSV